MKKLELSKADVKKFFLLTFATILISIGVYFFKFPNNFTFGGVTGLAVLLAKITPFSASAISFVGNMILLAVGFVFLGKKFGSKTAYTSILFSLTLSILEFIYPMTSPFTDEPILELAFAIAIPAFGSAILFNIGASSGGMEIIAMILKKFTSINIGRALFTSDIIVAVLSFFIFDIKTGLYSLLGLSLKSFMIDGVIERINLCKYFTIICAEPELICDYIVHKLKRSATICEGTGAFTGRKKYIIYTVLSPIEAVRLRTYIRESDSSAFMFISNTSEIIGKGFQSFY